MAELCVRGGVMDQTCQEGLAILGHKGTFTLFSYKDYVIRFKTSEKLEQYTRIVNWNNGYIVVMARYKGLGEVEEYIDLVPILENLYIQSNEFLQSIKEVRIDENEH